MITFIYIKTSFEGIHKYPDAPEEVSFLREPHRHIFHVKVKIQVFHDDREIEFILFKRFIISILKSLKPTGMYKGSMSCEQIGRCILDGITEKYGKKRKIVIDISEDNENGMEIHS